MKNLRAENVEILKTKVKLTISLEVNEYDIKTIEVIVRKSLETY